jgi:hypothetical protein
VNGTLRDTSEAALQTVTETVNEWAAHHSETTRAAAHVRRGRRSIRTSRTGQAPISWMSVKPGQAHSYSAADVVAYLMSGVTANIHALTLELAAAD